MRAVLGWTCTNSRWGLHQLQVVRARTELQSTTGVEILWARACFRSQKYQSSSFFKKTTTQLLWFPLGKLVSHSSSVSGPSWLGPGSPQILRLSQTAPRFTPTGTGPGPGMLGHKSSPYMAHRLLWEIAFNYSVKCSMKKFYLLGVFNRKWRPSKAPCRQHRNSGLKNDWGWPGKPRRAGTAVWGNSTYKVIDVWESLRIQPGRALRKASQGEKVLESLEAL